MTSKFADFDEYQLAKYNKDKKKPRKKIIKPKDRKDREKSNVDTEDSDFGESSQDEVKYENFFQFLSHDLGKNVTSIFVTKFEFYWESPHGMDGMSEND